MIKKLVRQLYSINIKLFLWFWLIAITSIISTQFISQQLAQDVLILPPHPNDQQSLYNTANKIRKHKPKNLADFLTKYQKNKHSLLLIKDVKTNIISPKINRFNDVFQYLEKNSFNTPTTIKLSNARITGPVKIKRGKKQLYIVHRDKKRNFGLMVRQLPYWLRIAIPVVISFALCWLLARTLSKPISTMKKVANQFGNGDLSARISDDGMKNDELGELAKTFNSMADKIQSNVKAHQRLLGDVSHELRSPMTRLQLAIAMADKSKTQPDVLAKHLARCELEVERLGLMIEDVLSLSRLENSLHNITLQKLNLVDVITPLIDDNQYLGETRFIKIKADIPQFCDVMGDEVLLASAINNILVNAIKYSPNNSEVFVSLKTNSSTITLSIIDQGNGVSQESITSLFKPFYRTSDARERKTGGTGLGLAIAKQAISIHNGTIIAENIPDAGLGITITLPLLTDSANIE